MASMQETVDPNSPEAEAKWRGAAENLHPKRQTVGEQIEQRKWMYANAHKSEQDRIFELLTGLNRVDLRLSQEEERCEQQVHEILRASPEEQTRSTTR
jgi:hypothetical protein